jgi:hypothetical protein
MLLHEGYSSTRYRLWNYKTIHQVLVLLLPKFLIEFYINMEYSATNFMYITDAFWKELLKNELWYHFPPHLRIIKISNQRRSPLRFQGWMEIRCSVILTASQLCLMLEWFVGKGCLNFQGILHTRKEKNDNQFKRLEILIPACEYIFSLINFITNNEEHFQSNAELHSVNTRHKHYLRKPTVREQNILWWDQNRL